MWTLPVCMVVLMQWDGNRWKLPEGYTWREFMYFLLSTLPERARKNYLRKLSVSVNFWRTKGGCLSDATIQKLIDAKVPIIVMDNSNYENVGKNRYVWNIRMISTFRNSKKYPRISECAFVFLRMTMPANIWDSHLQRRRWVREVKLWNNIES